ncbi:MAG: fumarylacetoacetate hydrolase family protein, partial [Alphaproteobacteria bacterium]|nr:fumarylacetoacetate hydrolase family protein [Alphaproteobacteria bacterium]
MAKAARRLKDNQVAGTALDALPETERPGSEDEAYALQDALNALLTPAGRGAICGWKVGCTTPVMQQYMGIDHPGGGAVFETGVHTSPAALQHDDYVGIGVEGEIAVRLAADLPSDQAPFDRAAIEAAAGDCIAAFELVDARYTDYRSLDTWTMVADNFFNAGCVLAPEARDWRELDLQAAEGVLTVNRAETGRGTGELVMGHPFNSVLWVANCLARRGIGLRAGDFVLTGSVVETQWLAKGDHARFAVSGLGTV